MKVAAYIRVSTDKEEQKDSLHNQQELLRSYVQEHDYDLHGFYTDIESGTTEKKKDFKRLLEDAENKQFDMIICKELSRLARNSELSHIIKRLAENNNIHIVTLDGIIDTRDPMNRAMFGFFAWVSEYESQRTSERIKAVFKTKAHEGLYLGSLPPYGYYIEDKKLYLRDDSSVETVRFIFERYLSGWGTDIIANHLTRNNVPTPATLSGKRDAGFLWYGSTIAKLLQNQAYIGNLEFNRETSISVTNRKRHRLRKDEHIIIEGTHDPIISSDKWHKAQAIIQERKTNRSIAKGEKHLFTGILKCPDCGRGFHFRSNREGYICGGYGKHGKHVCTSHSIKEEKLIEIILDDIKAFCRNLDTDKILSKVSAKTESINKRITSKIKKLEAEKQNLTARRSRFIDMLADNAISEAEYNDKMLETRSTIELIGSEINHLTASLQDSTTMDDILFLKTELESILKFDALTKEMLTLLVDKIEVTEKGEPVIFYKFAPTFDAVI